MLILLICGATIGGATYWFFKKTTYSPIVFKTNSLQKIITSKENILSNIWKGLTIYLWDKYLPTWQKGVSPTPEQKKEQRKLFHYNLRIEHVIDNDSNVQVNHQRPTIYFHGWGDTKNSAKLLKAFTDVLPGDIVTFHFHDQGVIIPKLRHANLGQLPDVLSGIYVLKWVKDMLNVPAVDLFGYSRGGATVLNLIAVLNDKKGLYDSALLRIGVDANERHALLTMIQNGCIVLNCPLTDMNTSVQERMKKYTPHILKALSRFTKYQPYGLQGLTSATTFEGLKLNILLHFQYHDTVVSNKNEAELYKILHEFNPKTTYLVLGNDGGHLHTHASLAQTIHTFKKMFGGSYDKQYDAQYNAIKHCKPFGATLLQPGKKVAQQISDYYDSCMSMRKA
jgi:hypothetical protein